MSKAKQVQITLTYTYTITEKDAHAYYDVDVSQPGWAQRAVDVDAGNVESSLAEAAEFICTTAGTLDVVSAEVLDGE